MSEEALPESDAASKPSLGPAPEPLSEIASEHLSETAPERSSDADNSQPKPPRRNPLRRPGCVIALIIWFAILLIPCFLINLAINGEVLISTGSAPGQEVRLWLISEAYERGVGLSTASVHQSSDSNALCVETSVRFLLWTGQADPSLYCDCYQRASADADWSQTNTISSACPA